MISQDVWCISISFSPSPLRHGNYVDEGGSSTKPLFPHFCQGTCTTKIITSAYIYKTLLNWMFLFILRSLTNPNYILKRQHDIIADSRLYILTSQAISGFTKVCYSSWVLSTLCSALGQTAIDRSCSSEQSTTDY